MRREDARSAIIDHWYAWSDLMAESDYMAMGVAMNLFYEYLQSKHPQCLDFRSADAYSEMKAWIYEDCEP
ncbi:hypothetical protein [Comamonas sp. F1-6]|uniref:hypothetical protein n=1 Tax=Comamonas sp. F1-6 TaxID=673550 RepID=UPI0031E3C66D